MRLLFLSSLVVGAYLLGASCERHDWEETKKLHQPHGGHDEHGEKAGHEKDAGHEEDGDEEGSAGKGAGH